MNILYLGVAGGLFALLALVHFVVDWIFQTHSEAMVKHNNPKVRAKHCLIYTIGFIPLLYFFEYSWLQWLIALNVLFWSHFVEDTYMPVYLWARYIRKPPEMFSPALENSCLQYNYDAVYRGRGDAREAQVLDELRLQKEAKDSFAKKGFIDFVQTPLGKILMIAVDQIIHLSFLLPLVYMAMT